MAVFPVEMVWGWQNGSDDGCRSNGNKSNSHDIGNNGDDDEAMSGQWWWRRLLTKLSCIQGVRNQLTIYDKKKLYLKIERNR